MENSSSTTPEMKPDGLSLADPKLLDKVDRLFELNVGESVALPQVLVVGDQSSSVLEGLFDLDFPRSTGLCTRFATQITFRRNPDPSVTITIIPGPRATSAYAEKLRAWRANLESLDRDAFGETVKQAHGLMGLGEDRNSDKTTKKTFSDDVLKIEIQGPTQEHLSVIDVPGIFRQTTAGVTTKADIEMVRATVLSYMKNERSVMLTVIPANVDIATQEILELAEECDPSGRRTLGVLTKPDLVDKGAELEIINIIAGKIHPLNLGWCVVRNAGQQDLSKSSLQRQLTEQVFFKTYEPWRKIAKDRAGITALRSRLVEILSDLVKREFSKVKADIGITLKAKKKELELLGPSRANADEQLRYLLGLANKFQSVASLALAAHYGANDLFESVKGLKLATAVATIDVAFAENMSKLGHTRAFKRPYEADSDDGDDSDGGDDAEDAEDADDSEEVEYKTPAPVKKVVCSVVSRHPMRTPFAELDGIVEQPVTIEISNSRAVLPWLREIYNDSRGLELGTFNESLLPIAWKKQSSNWEPLSLGYVSDFIEIIHSFILMLLSAICGDERVVSALREVLMEPLLKRYERAMEQARCLLLVERDGTLLTSNHYFAENLEKCRQQRIKAKLKKSSYIDEKGYRVVKLDTTVATTTASNHEHAIGDLHDILQSYYKIAIKRFVDDMRKQATDFHLLKGNDTPIRVFSPQFVSQLTPEQLETIAGEDLIARRKRGMLEHEVKNLIEGMKVLG